MRESVSSLRGSIVLACAASVLVCVAGCAQILGLGDVEVVDPVGDCPAAPPDTVIACANMTHVALDGTTYVSRKDLSRFTVAAYIADGSASGFRVVSGTAGRDGIARIEGVPDGTPYYFRLHDPLDPSYYWPHYFYTDKHTLEIGHTLIGRDDTPATADTQVTVNLTGMTPWSARDAVTLTSFQTGTDFPVASGMAVPLGATMFSSTGDWRTGFGESSFSDITDSTARAPQLVDQSPARGDDLWALHHAARILDSSARHPFQILTLVDAAQLTGVTMTNGSPLTISGSFQPVPAASSPLSFSMNAALFRAAFRDGGRYTDETLGCSVNATPAATQGLMMAFASLVLITATNIPGNETGVQLTLPYANPFPVSWPLVLRCSLGHTRLARVPGTTRTSFGFSYITSFTPVTASDLTWAPQIQSVTNLKIGGVDGLAPGRVAFDGTTPVTMAWDPVPGVTHYQIRVKDESTGRFLAVFDSTQPSITMPADTFTKGNFYVFRVFAIQTSGEYVAGKLLDFAAPLWSARISTAMFRFSDDCGDGNVDAGEECDGGASGSTATCDADCSLPSCGDGFHNELAQEQCDDTLASPQCGTDCKLPACGDGSHNRLAGEECDDGNTASGDTCSAACKLERCGNQMTDPPFELCDDGNRASGDGCDALCQSEP